MGTPQTGSSLRAQILQRELDMAPLSAYPAIQHSAYLAQALESLRQGAAENIRSKGALASNLLAEAIDSWAGRRADAKALQAIQTGMASERDNSLRTLGYGPDAGSGAGASATSSPGAPPTAGAPDSSATGSVSPSASAPTSGGGVGSPDTIGAYAALTPSNPLITYTAPSFSPDTSGRPSVSSAGLADALHHFVSEGYSPAGAAGLVGNFEQESGQNLSLNNPSEGAFGAANWRGDRLKGLQAFAAANKSDPSSLDTQLAYVDREMDGPFAGVKAGLMNATDPVAAAAIATGYERPAGWRPGGDPSAASGWGNRAANAEGLYASMSSPGQSNPSPGQASTATASQAPPAPRPVQVSTGPDPSIPAPSAIQDPGVASPYGVAQRNAPPPVNGNLPVSPGQGAPSATISAVPAMASAGAPQVQGASSGAPQGIAAPAPTSPNMPGLRPTPQQVDLLRQLYANPRTYQQARAYALQLQEQMAARPEYEAHYDPENGQTIYTPKVPGSGSVQIDAAPQGWRPHAPAGYAYDAQGRLQPQWMNSAPVRLSPTSFGYQDPHGDWTVKDVGGLQGAPPAGMRYSGNGSLEPVPGAQNAPYGPGDIIKLRDQIEGSKPIQEARDAASNYGALVQLAQQPGGIKAYAVRDALARLFSGGVARSAQVYMQEGAQGMPDAVKGYFMNLRGDGNLDPRILQQSLDAALAFTNSRLGVANQYNASNAQFAQRRGIDARDIAADLGAAPSYYNVPGQRSAYAPPQAPGPGPAPVSQIASADAIAQARAAIDHGANRQAVIARLQHLGINPAGL
jgi:hypothetical protein